MTLTYVWNGTGYTITSADSVGSNEIIPSTYDDGVHGVANVNKIGPYVFLDRASLESISIPNTITEINDSAFAFCNLLNNVVIPNSVTTIGSECFRNCSSLTTIIIGNGVTSIGSSAFSSSGLTTVSIPNNVINLGTWVFSSCGNLHTVTFGTGLYRIPDLCFFNCSNLKNINMFSNITEIGKYSFSNTSIDNLDFFTSSVSLIDDYAFLACPFIINLIIPDGVITIGTQAFYGNGTLLSVVIGNGTVNIRAGAFGNCFNLKKIVFGASVNNLGYAILGNCFSLTKEVYFLGHAPQIFDLNTFSATYFYRIFKYSTKNWPTSFANKYADNINYNPNHKIQTFGEFPISRGNILIKKNISGIGRMTIKNLIGVPQKDTYIYFNVAGLNLEFVRQTEDFWISIDEGWWKLEQVTEIYNPGNITIYYWKVYFDDGVDYYTIATNPIDLNPNTNSEILQKKDYIPFEGWSQDVEIKFFN